MQLIGTSWLTGIFGRRPRAAAGSRWFVAGRALPLLLALLFLSLYSTRAQINGGGDRTPCTDTCCKTDALLLNTGYNYDNSSVFATHAPDNFWTVTFDAMGGPVPRCAQVIVPSPVWGAPMPNTQWIASTPTHTNNVNGRYTFEKCFCVCDSGTFQFNIRIRMDDSGSINVDGVQYAIIPLSITPSPTIYTFSFPVTLAPGIHCIDVNDINVYQISAGFDMDATVQGKGLVKFSCCGIRCNVTPPLVNPCDTNNVTLGSDGSWSLVAAPSGGILPRCADVVVPQSPSWGPPVPGSRWIGSRPDGHDPVNGIYDYRKCFCTSKRTSLTMTVSAMGDDAVDVTFAGTTIIHYPNWAGTVPKTVTIPISLDSGCHCLDFLVDNQSGIETGLDAMIRLSGPGLLKPECCACGACTIAPMIPRQRDLSDGAPAGLTVPDAGNTGNMLLSVPNPTTGETTIYYSLAKASVVKLEIYDEAGKLIGTLDEGSRSSGRHAIPYNAHGAASGNYRVQMVVDADKSYTIPLAVQR